MKVHKAITLATDIMFVNIIPFLVTTSQDIMFGTVKALNDCKVPMVVQKLRSITSIYKHCGFQNETILAEFEGICPWFPSLNCCGANEHIPDIEQYICTIKDQTQSTYQILPLQHIPRVMLIHLVKNAVLWLNSFPHHDGVSSEHSPRFLLMRYELSYDTQAVLEFGAYVQTHEEHTNDMTQWTQEPYI